MTTSLLSTYRQGENRVTSTFMAVLERLSLPNINRILGALMEDADFSLVSIQNQPKREHSTPDAVIGTGQSIVIETKTAPNALSSDQVKRELKDLNVDESLLILTPDESLPPLLSKDPFLNDPRVIWSNFTRLAGVIENVLNGEDDENEPPTEREAFLLREFLRMLKEDRLLFSAEDRVLVVGARLVYPLYKPLGVFITKASRTFRPSRHIAFYVNGKVEPVVPRIEFEIDRVQLTPDGILSLQDAKARDRACKLRKDILCLNDPNVNYGVSDGFIAKVLVLSAHKDKGTINLKRGPIIHDGKGAFVQGHRYVTLESLKSASKTSELVRC